MISKIVKRDGSIVDFDQIKIVNAIDKANKVTKELTHTDILFVTERVVNQINETNNTVEQIQDLVEEALIQYNFKTTAKEYIIYRENHNKIRKNESFLMNIYNKITYVDSKNEDLKRENANIDGDTSMAAMLRYGSEGSKFFIDNYVLPKDISLAHTGGDIHIHDKDFYMLTETCCQIELDRLFANGFNTGHGYIRQPQSIESASSLACIVVQSNQNEMHGGQSIPALDYYLAPYVTKTYEKELKEACINYLSISNKFNEEQDSKIKDTINTLFSNVTFKLPKDNYNLGEESDKISGQITLDDSDIHLFGGTFIIYSMLAYAIPRAISKTDKRTHQAMESFIHNLCSLHARAGGQIPFSSVNYGTDTSPEGRMVIRNLLKATEEGLGLGETPIFPVQIFKLKQGVNYNPEDPNYDLFKYSMAVSAKRLYPNYSNLDSSFNKPYYKENDPNTEVSYMGAVSSGYVKLYLPCNSIKFCTIKIDQLYYFLRDNGLCTPIKQFDDYTWYTEVTEQVYIRDSLSDSIYVLLKKWMQFNDPKTKWYKLTTKSGYNNLFTSDHPLYIFNKVKYKDNLSINEQIERKDISSISEDFRSYNCFLVDNEKAELEEIVSIEQDNIRHIGYDVETASDRFNIYIDDPDDDTRLLGVVSANCRTRVIGNVYDKNREVTGGRGNLSFTTINLPRLGILAEKDIDKFFSMLDEKIDLCFRQLLHRLGIQKKRKAKNYPFLMLNGIWMDSEKLDPDDEVGDVLNHGTLTIGFIGLAETLVALTGKHHGESEEAQKLGLSIVKHMRDRCDTESNKTNLNFTLIATPAEGLCGRFVKIDREKFGVIPGVTDRKYYTNSMHCPVYFNISAYKKIQIEAPYHKYCNAGVILYVEFDADTVKNLEAFESVIRYMVDQDAGYFSINHPVDRDPVCGYVGVINDVCPRCGRREGEGISLEKLKELRRKYPDVPLAKEER